MADNEAKTEAILSLLESIGGKVFYEKQLTSSDVSASGRVVVPKVINMPRSYRSSRCCQYTHRWTWSQQAIAEQYFPKIDSATGRELEVEDASGAKYTLRFRSVLCRRATCS
jgi:hypothetical protein